MRLFLLPLAACSIACVACTSDEFGQSRSSTFPIRTDLVDVATEAAALLPDAPERAFIRNYLSKRCRAVLPEVKSVEEKFSKYGEIDGEIVVTLVAQSEDVGVTKNDYGSGSFEWKWVHEDAGWKLDEC